MKEIQGTILSIQNRVAIVQLTEPLPNTTEPVTVVTNFGLVEGALILGPPKEGILGNRCQYPSDGG